MANNETYQTVDNPFLIWPPHELDTAIENTAETLGLQSFSELLQRGGKLARNRRYGLEELERNGQLSEEDRTALERENEKDFWGQSSKVLRGSMLVSSLGAIIQGWTQSVNNGAIPGLIDDFGLKIFPATATGDQNQGHITAAVWKFAILNAIPFFTGGLISPLLVDPLQHRYLGRRGAIFVASLLTLGSTIAACFMKSYAGLLITRGLSGIAIGAKASIIPIYASEISPYKIRGRIGANWQIMDALGVAFGFAAVLSIEGADLDRPLEWRLMTATILIPTLILIALVYTSAAESPYWKLKSGQPVQAFIETRHLRRNDLIAAKDFIYAQAQLNVESRLRQQRRSKERDVMRLDLANRLARAGNSEKPELSQFLYEMRETGYWQRFATLFRDPGCRRALLCSTWAMASQQLTGINVIALLLFIFYQPSTTNNFSHKDLMTNAYIGFAFGVVNFLSGLPAYWLADRVGRATLMLIGLPNQAWLTLVLAFCLNIPDGVKRNVVCGFVICLYTAVYSFTSGTSPFAIAAEVFPLSVREVGMGVSVAANLVICGLVVALFVPCSYALGHEAGFDWTASLCIFAALNVIAWIGVLLFVPETKGRTLEELQYTFDLPLKKHAQYRVFYEPKMYWKIFVKRQKHDVKPFYEWARQSST